MNVQLTNKKLESKIEEIKKHYIHEEYKNDLWTVHTETFDKKNSKDWNIFASVNGKITDGDRLRVRVIPRNIESCNIGNIITTFYTYSNVKNSLSKVDGGHSLANPSITKI